MIRLARVIMTLMLTRAAVPQTPEELVQTAARAMHQHDYATAEEAASFSSCLPMWPKCTAIWVSRVIPRRSSLARRKLSPAL